GRAVAEVALQFGPGGAEAGAAVQVRGLAEIPGVVGRRFVGRPGVVFAVHGVSSLWPNTHTVGLTLRVRGFRLRSERATLPRCPATPAPGPVRPGMCARAPAPGCGRWRGGPGPAGPGAPARRRRGLRRGAAGPCSPGTPPQFRALAAPAPWRPPAPRAAPRAASRTGSGGSRAAAGPGRPRTAPP